MTIPTQDSAPTINNGRSESSMVAEIQSLTEEVQRLSGAYGWWSRASQVFIGATAVVTVLYFIASGIALKRASELQSAQEQLGKIKDSRLVVDLKDKEEKIAVAKGEAGKANKSAGEANERASLADERAATADERAGKANERAGELEKGAAEARLKQEELRKQNLETESRLEKERSERLELEGYLSPRLLIFSPEGVLTETSVVKSSIANLGNSQAAALLVSYLEANDWDARDAGTLPDSGWSWAKKAVGEPPEGTVRIRVGAKSASYFTNKAAGDLLNDTIRKQLDEIRAKTKERRAALRKAWGLPAYKP